MRLHCHQKNKGCDFTEKGILSAGEIPDEKELELINRFTRRKMAAEELYCFTVVLCDNDIDRDNERFTVGSLKALADLFVGKTGISDHSQRSADQCARIFSTEVETVDGAVTADGQPYTRLKARAYMPRSESNEKLMLEIDSGIKKEVSVGCSCRRQVCSVCGSDKGCGHIKGRIYNEGSAKRRCFFELCDPYDAYEWSFVAVPAQPKAGVTKSFKGKAEDNMKTDEIVKSLKSADSGITLTAEQCRRIAKHIENAEAAANAAKEFLAEQKKHLLSKFLTAQDAESGALLSAVIDRMDGAELFKLFTAASRRSESAVPQLKRSARRSDKSGKNKNSAFSF